MQLYFFQASSSMMVSEFNQQKFECNEWFIFPKSIIDVIRVKCFSSLIAVFWVFGTDVMVTVAKSFDGPIMVRKPDPFSLLLSPIHLAPVYTLCYLRSSCASRGNLRILWQTHPPKANSGVYHRLAAGIVHPLLHIYSMLTVVQ